MSSSSTAAPPFACPTNGHFCLTTTHPTAMAYQIPEFFPWFAAGPLCPLLQDPAIWLKVFESSLLRYIAKKAYRRCRGTGVVRSTDPASFGKVLLWLVRDQPRRNALAKVLNQEERDPLHRLLFRRFWGDDEAFQKIMPLEDVCREEQDGVYFIEVDRFQTWLTERRYAPEQARSIAIVGCAFAMLQPDDAPAILSVLLDHDPIFGPWLTGGRSVMTLARKLDRPENIEMTEKEFPKDNEPVVTTANGPIADRDKTAITGEAEPLEISEVGDLFELERLREGTDILAAFIEAHRKVHQVIEQLPAQLDNLPVSDINAEEALSDQFAHALAEARAIGVDAETLLARLSKGLQLVEIDELSKVESVLSTLSVLVGRSRKTRDLLRNACDEIHKLLSDLIANGNSRNERLSQALLEIHKVDDLLGRARFEPTYPLPTGSLLLSLRALPELEEQLAQARTDRDAFLLARKGELRAQLAAIAEHYDPKALPADLSVQFELLGVVVHESETPEALASAQLAVSVFQDTLRARPEIRSISDLADEASMGKPTTATVLPVARALNVRGRAIEALALLNCLQLTTEIETDGPDDFSALVDELIRSAAALSTVEGRPLVWIDGIFQQPWLRELGRSDLRSQLTWQRLAVAFVVQEHLRGSEQEMDLFYRMEFQNTLLRDRFPVLSQLLHGIATRHPLRIFPDRPASPLLDTERRVRELFKRDDHGDYILQAASGDMFHSMEKFHLFPSLEAILTQVHQLCELGEWVKALQAADHKADRLLNDACRSANVSATENAFYRRKVLDPQIGYLPKFLRELKQLIDNTEVERSAYANHVRATDVLAEVARLTAEEPEFEIFWAAVRQTLETPHTATVGALSSAEQLFERLSHYFGSVATLTVDYVVGLCGEGPGYKPTANTLRQMLRHLAAPSPARTLSRLRNGKCYRHALRVIDELGPVIVSSLSEDNSETLRSQTSHQLVETESQLVGRWNALAGNLVSGLSPDDCESALQDGCFVYLDKLLTEAEARVARASEEARSEVLAWLQAENDRLTEIKQTAVAAESSAEWLSVILGHCGTLERALLLARREVIRGRSPAFSRDLLKDAVSALQFVADAGAQSFTEIDCYIAQLLRSEPAASIQPAAPVEIAIPEIALAWKKLCSLTQLTQEHVGAPYQDLARQFCSACRLYHDLHQTLIFSAVRGYRWGRYTTRFHNPRSSWLDREVRLYLCFGEKTPPEELEPLAVELEEHRGSLNLVFVPQGHARLARLWKYDPFHSPFVLINADLLAHICSARDSAGTAKHDVPLRQALHQSAEDLTGIGLFKSEGYVHLHKNIFVGRELALQQLVQQPASVIWGGRRTGKTSLLQALGERLRHPGLKGGPYRVAFVYSDKGGGDPDLAIARAITKDLGLQNPENLEDFESSMLEICTRERVAVLIDEMDRYIEISRQAHGATAFPIARLLRGLSQRDSAQHFKFVYAGFKQLFYEVRVRPGADPSDPFKNILQPVMKDFRDLDLKEVEELMRIGFVEMLGINMDLSVPRLVTAKTSGHPAFVQRFCERLLARLSQRRKLESQLRLTAEDVEDTYKEQTPLGSAETAFIDYVNETLGWNVSHLERAILLAISTDIRSSHASERRDYSDQQIMEQLRFWCDATIPLPDSYDFQNALTMLAMTKMLTPVASGTGQRYRITYPAYIDFMSRLDQIGKVEIFKSLQDYHDEERGLIK